MYLQPPSLLGPTGLHQPPQLQPTAQVIVQPPIAPPPVISAMPTTSTAAAVVAQSAHNVMQQAMSLGSADQIILYDNLRKHPHSEGLLRGMSVSAKSKRRVMCLKEGCPGCEPLPSPAAALRCAVRSLRVRRHPTFVLSPCRCNDSVKEAGDL